MPVRTRQSGSVGKVDRGKKAKSSEAKSLSPARLTKSPTKDDSSMEVKKKSSLKESLPQSMDSVSTGTGLNLRSTPKRNLRVTISDITPPGGESSSKTPATTASPKKDGGKLQKLPKNETPNKVKKVANVDRPEKSPPDDADDEADEREEVQSDTKKRIRKPFRKPPDMPPPPRTGRNPNSEGGKGSRHSASPSRVTVTRSKSSIPKRERKEMDQSTDQESESDFSDVFPDVVEIDPLAPEVHTVNDESDEDFEDRNDGRRSSETESDGDRTSRSSRHSDDGEKTNGSRSNSSSEASDNSNGKESDSFQDGSEDSADGRRHRSQNSNDRSAKRSGRGGSDSEVSSKDSSDGLHSDEQERRHSKKSSYRSAKRSGRGGSDSEVSSKDSSDGLHSDEQERRRSKKSSDRSAKRSGRGGSKSEVSFKVSDGLDSDEQERRRSKKSTDRLAKRSGRGGKGGSDSEFGSEDSHDGRGRRVEKLNDRRLAKRSKTNDRSGRDGDESDTQDSGFDNKGKEEVAPPHRRNKRKLDKTKAKPDYIQVEKAVGHLKLLATTYEEFKSKFEPVLKFARGHMDDKQKHYVDKAMRLLTKAESLSALSIAELLEGLDINKDDVKRYASQMATDYFESAGGVQIHPDAGLFTTGWDGVHYEMCVSAFQPSDFPLKPLDVLPVTPVARREWLHFPNFEHSKSPKIFTYTLRNGMKSKLVYIGYGIAVNKDVFDELVRRANMIWPCEYGRLKFGKATRDSKSMDHLKFFEMVAKSIWPTWTYRKCSSLPLLGQRPQFHRLRVTLMVNFTEQLYKLTKANKEGGGDAPDNFEDWSVVEKAVTGYITNIFTRISKQRREDFDRKFPLGQEWLKQAWARARPLIKSVFGKARERFLTTHPNEWLDNEPRIFDFQDEPLAHPAKKGLLDEEDQGVNPHDMGEGREGRAKRSSKVMPDPELLPSDDEKSPDEDDEQQESRLFAVQPSKESPGINKRLKPEFAGGKVSAGRKRDLSPSSNFPTSKKSKKQSDESNIEEMVASKMAVMTKKIISEVTKMVKKKK